MTISCEEIEDLGKGIGNASRWEIIQALLKGPRTVSEVVATVEMSQSAVSQHLRTLKECNLVSGNRRGQEVYYSLNTEYTVELLRKLLDDICKCPTTIIEKGK